MGPVYKGEDDPDPGEAQFRQVGWLFGICNYIKTVLPEPMTMLRELETFFSNIGTAVGPMNVQSLRIPVFQHIPCLTDRFNENMTQIVCHYEDIFENFRQWGINNAKLSAYSGKFFIIQYYFILNSLS